MRTTPTSPDHFFEWFQLKLNLNHVVRAQHDAHWRRLALHLFLLAIRLTNYHTFPYVQQCPPKKFLCFAMTSLRGCVAAACFSLALAQDEYLITSLPGWGGKQAMYSGYINVSSQRNLFFWLVESSSPSADLVMWTNGGPGCSSLSGGLFSELGPFRSSPDGTLKPNPWSWDSAAHMLFVEQPAGVGFSYSENASDYTVGDARAAADVVSFFYGFFAAFPRYANTPLRISGESYGGHYVPNIAAAIVAANLAKTGPAINLKGFLVGNAWTNAFFDNTGAVQMWLDRGMISEEIFDGVTTTCNMSDVGPLLARWGRGGVAHGRAAPLGFVPLAGRPVAGGLDCDGWQNAAQTALGVIDIYDVFADACLGAETAPPAAVAGVSSNSAAGCAASYDPCIGDSTTAYLNRADVQKAIHVRPGTVPGGAWAGCSSVVSYSREDLLTSMLPVYDFLLTRAPGLAYLVFSGDVDGIVPFTGTRAWLTKGLAWPAATALHAWPAPDGQTGGWAYSFSHPTSGGKLQFASIRNAGHMTQATQQARALAMFRAYLAGKEL